MNRVTNIESSNPAVRRTLSHRVWGLATIARQLLVAVALIGIGSASASGAIVETFRTDTAGGGTFVGNTFTLELTGLSEGGVTFDAELTVIGSGNLNQNGSGLGIDGGSDLVDDGESLRFSMTISNIVGGMVYFDGFTEMDFNFLDNDDVAVLSLDDDESTTGDNFLNFAGNVNSNDIADISGTSPTLFSAFAQSGASNSFRVDDISGQFSTAVPEPASGVVLALGCFLAAGRYRRRLRNQARLGERSA